MADAKHLLAQLAEEYDRLQAHIDSLHNEGNGNRDPEGEAPVVGLVDQNVEEPAED